MLLGKDLLSPIALVWSHMLYSEFLPSSLHAVVSLTFSLSGSPLSHSSLAILCNGTVCSPELHLFSVKWLEQGEWAAFIPAACVQNFTQRGSKSQPTKQIM